MDSNREYGFQRWYSQLKRLQRYGHMFPGVFPRLLGYGQEGNKAYFDIEYIDGAETLFDYLSRETNNQKIDRCFDALVEVMDKMHEVELPSSDGAYKLYIHEEIEQRIKACIHNARFNAFSANEEVIFNGVPSKGLIHALPEYIKMFASVYKNQKECFTHGNLTLENILYQPDSNKIIFIDPYEENVIDSRLAEYSQLLQSSNSLYELYNSADVKIVGNSVEAKINVPYGIKYFNDKFKQFMQTQLSADEIIISRLLEISQFARMLPFKMEIDEDKMLFFYALGSRLFHELKLEHTDS